MNVITSQSLRCLRHSDGSAQMVNLDCFSVSEVVIVSAAVVITTKTIRSRCLSLRMVISERSALVAVMLLTSAKRKKEVASMTETLSYVLYIRVALYSTLLDAFYDTLDYTPLAVPSWKHIYFDTCLCSPDNIPLILP